MDSKIFGEIRRIIAKVLEAPADEITQDTAIGDMDSWDSLHQLMIISTIEREYGFRFTPDVMIELEDVGDIVHAVEERVQ